MYQIIARTGIKNIFPHGNRTHHHRPAATAIHQRHAAHHRTWRYKIRRAGQDESNIKVEIKESPRPPFRHTVDLYNDNHLEKFIRKAAEKLETGTTIIAASLNELTEKLEHYRLELIKQNAENKR